MLTPRENSFFCGHEMELKHISALLASGRVPQAFLLAGQRGIGKATLAFRLARFILRGGLDDMDGGLFGAPEINLDMSPEHPTFKKISGKVHPDLMVLETDEDNKEITVDDARKIGGFLRMSSAESGWRVVIIDSVDEMNRNSANSLLKILEEPTAKSILILISHSPGRLLPTIRSRCNLIKLNPLTENQIKEIFIQQAEGSDDAPAEFAIKISSGSPGLALSLKESDALTIYENFLEIISKLPEPDISQISHFSDLAAAKNEWDAVNYLAGRFIVIAAKYLSGAAIDFALPEEEAAIRNITAFSSLKKLSAISDKLQNWRTNDEIFHLERKLILNDIFNLFKQAA